MHLGTSFCVALTLLIVAFSVLAFAFLVPSCSAATPPVVINGGAYFTNSPVVTLTLDVSIVFANFTLPEMSINNTESSKWTNWEAYSTPKAWTLTSGDGLKTVYVRFRIVTGYSSVVNPPIPIYQTSAVYSASVTLDTTPPTLTITAPAANGTEITSSTLQASWTATDTGSGVNCTEVLLPSGNWINVGADTTYTLVDLNNGDCTFGVRAVDNAGNAATATVSLTVNVAQPTPTPSYAPTPTSSDSPAPTPTSTPTPALTAITLPSWLPTALIVGAVVAAGIAAPMLAYRQRKRNYDRKKTEKNFDLETTSDGATKVHFGDGENGVRLSAGKTVTATYRTGGETAGKTADRGPEPPEGMEDASAGSLPKPHRKRKRRSKKRDAPPQSSS